MLLRSWVVSIGCLLLVGCSTPQYILKNEKTGQVATCGGSATGSLAGGMIGHEIQKTNDKKCVAAYIGQGFEIVQ